MQASTEGGEEARIGCLGDRDAGPQMDTLPTIREEAGRSGPLRGGCFVETRLHPRTTTNVPGTFRIRRGHLQPPS